MLGYLRANASLGFIAMTTPQEHLDQMLSGYLDDALTGEERAEVDQRLRRDPAVVVQLQEMSQLRESLRQIAASDRQIKLDAGFSGRVMEAAVARARSEGLAEDHPLVRVSEQPTSIRPASVPRSWRKAAGILVAVAASAAVLIFSRDSLDEGTANNESSPALMAGLVNPEELNGLVEQTIAPEPAALNPEATGTVRQTPIDQIASSQSPAVSIRPAAEVEVAAEMTADTESRPIKIALVPSAKSLANDNKPVTELSAVLVLDVRQTAQGRANGAVRRAIRASAIDREGEKSVSFDLLGAATESANVSSDQKVSLIYLQAPAKTLDRLYLNLLVDEEGVQSVGMTIATDAPVLKVVNAIQPDPTSVRHNGMLLLPNHADAMSSLSSQLSGLDFLPLDAALVKGIASDSGPDINSQVLVLIR